MCEPSVLLLALQHGDSQAPGGGFAFSWGLEGLAADGRFLRTDLADFMEGQLVHRWACFDRPIVARAHGYHGIEDVTRLDATVDAWLPIEPQRTGSARAGNALLGFHQRMGTPGARAFRAAIEEGQAVGHLPVVQGVVWQGIGASRTTALTLSAHCMVSGLAGAALRLGKVSHVDAQGAIARLRPLISTLIEEPVPPIGSLHAFTPLSDIAMLRSQERDVRLFSN